MLLFIVQDLRWKNSSVTFTFLFFIYDATIYNYIYISVNACVTSEWVKRLNELIGCVRVRAKRQFAQTRCDSFAGGRPIRDQRLNRTSRARESPWSRIVENGVALEIRKNLTVSIFPSNVERFELWTFAFIYVFDHDVAYKWIRDTWSWSIRWRGWDGTWLRKRLPDDGEINHCVTNCCDLSNVSLLRCQTGSIYFGHAGLHRSILDSM